MAGLSGLPAEGVLGNTLLSFFSLEQEEQFGSVRMLVRIACCVFTAPAKKTNCPIKNLFYPTLIAG